MRFRIALDITGNRKDRCAPGFREGFGEGKVIEIVDVNIGVGERYKDSSFLNASKNLYLSARKRFDRLDMGEGDIGSVWRVDAIDLESTG